METKRRILWVDYSKTICIILMVIGHAGLSSVDANFRGFIYYFHIPCLFVISGYLDKKKDLGSLLFSLGVPIIAFNVLNYPWYMYNLQHQGIPFTFQSMVLAPIAGLWLHDFDLGHPLCGPFWFVIALMIDKLVVHYLLPVKRTGYEVLAAIFCVCLIASNVEILDSKWLFMVKKAIISMPFFVFGRILKSSRSFDLLMNIKTPDRRYWYTVVGTGGGIIVVLSLFFIVNSSVDMYQERFGNIAVYYMGGLIGSLLVILVSKCLAEKFTCHQMIINISQGTLVILGLHQFFIFAINKAFHFRLLFPNQGIVIALVTIALLYPLIIFILNKCPIVIGKK